MLKRLTNTIFEVHHDVSCEKEPITAIVEQCDGSGGMAGKVSHAKTTIAQIYQVPIGKLLSNL